MQGCLGQRGWSNPETFIIAKETIAAELRQVARELGGEAMDNGLPGRAELCWRLQQPAEPTGRQLKRP